MARKSKKENKPILSKEKRKNLEKKELSLNGNAFLSFPVLANFDLGTCLDASLWHDVV